MDDLKDGNVDGSVDGLKDGSGDGLLDRLKGDIIDMEDFVDGSKDGHDEPKMDGNDGGSVDGCIDGNIEGLVDGNLPMVTTSQRWNTLYMDWSMAQQMSVIGL